MVLSSSDLLPSLVQYKVHIPIYIPTIYIISYHEGSTVHCTGSFETYLFEKTHARARAAAKLNHVMALCLNCQNVFSAVVNVMV